MAKLYLKDSFGKSYPLLRVGDPGDLLEGSPKDATCGDCGQRMGEYHRLYCDIQVCPICKGQLLSCEHSLLPVMADGFPRHRG